MLKPNSSYSYTSTRRRHYHKTSSILPLSIAVLIVVAIVLIVRFLINNYSVSTSDLVEDNKIYFSVEQGNGKIFNVSGVSLDVLDNTPHSLYEGESISVQNDSYGGLKLDNTLVRLNANSKLALTDIKTPDHYTVSLLGGEVWGKVEKDSVRALRVDVGQAYLDTPYAVFDVDKDPENVVVRVIKGEVKVTVVDPVKKDPVGQFTVGLGQMVKVDNALWRDLKEKNKEPVDLVSAMDPEFNNSTWYKFNSGQDTFMSTREQSETNEKTDQTEEDSSGTGAELTLPEGKNLTVSFPNNNYTTNKQVLKFFGALSSDVKAVYVNDLKAEIVSGKWIAYNVALPEEGDNKFVIQAEIKGQRTTITTITVSKDTVVPATPVITSPEDGSKNTDGVVRVSGTIKEKVAKIVVNDYTLQRFRPGDRTWQYIANKNYGDLKEGLNSFKVVAVDAAGNISEPATLTVTYTPVDKVKEGTGALLP